MKLDLRVKSPFVPKVLPFLKEKKKNPVPALLIEFLHVCCCFHNTEIAGGALVLTGNGTCDLRKGHRSMSCQEVGECYGGKVAFVRDRSWRQSVTLFWMAYRKSLTLTVSPTL